MHKEFIPRYTANVEYISWYSTWGLSEVGTSYFTNP